MDVLAAQLKAKDLFAGETCIMMGPMATSRSFADESDC